MRLLAALLLLRCAAAAARASNASSANASSANASVARGAKAYTPSSTDWTTTDDAPSDHNLSVPLGQRPRVLGHEEVPSHAYFTFETVRLANVDVLKGTFTLDGYVFISLRDDRLRAPPLSYGDGDTLDKTLFDDCISSCTHRPTVVWSPFPEVVNDGTGALAINLDYSLSFDAPAWLRGDEAAVDMPSSTATATAWVTATDRLFVELTADFLMHGFPFDWHDVGLHLESRAAHFKDLRWVPCSSLQRALLPPSEVAGWTVLGVGTTVSDRYHPIDDTFFSHLHTYVRLVRQPGIYNLRFTLGSSLLTLMAFFTLFIKPDEPDRLGFANACFLGIVSWQFILVSSTPALGYPTRMDVFLVVSLVFIAAVYVWNAAHAAYWSAVDDMCHAGGHHHGGHHHHHHDGGACGGASNGLGGGGDEHADHGQPSPHHSRARVQAVLAAAAEEENGHAAAKHVEPPPRPGLASRALAAVSSWGRDGQGFWAHIGVHRKLDLLAFFVLSAGYATVSAIIMAAWMDPPGTPGITGRARD